MTAHTHTSPDTKATTPSGRAARARMVPAGSAVMAVVVRVAGIVPARLDLTHVGTAEQQLGLSVGTVLVYLRSAVTARAVAQAWGQAAVLARSLSPALAERRPMRIGLSPVGVLVQLAGVPHVDATLIPAHRGPDAAVILRVPIGPVVWEVCDSTAYTSLLRAWRQAARLLADNPTEFDDDEDDLL